MNTIIRTARCCCGAARVRVSGEPEIHALCHCDNCKQRTGSAFGVSAYFQLDQVLERLGATRSYQVTTEHNQQQRHFCETCGTTLFWFVSTMADRIGIAGGCFTDSPLAQPQASIIDQERCDWVQLPATIATSLPVSTD